MEYPTACMLKKCFGINLVVIQTLDVVGTTSLVFDNVAALVVVSPAAAIEVEESTGMSMGVGERKSPENARNK